MGRGRRDEVIAEEQQAVDRAYQCLERQKEETERLSRSPAGASAKDSAAQREEFARMLASYGDLDEESLVFMRVDTEEAPEEHATHYIGRRSVRDEDGELAVISWTARAAVQWRLVKQKDPGEVRLRRRINCQKDRVTGYFDEIDRRPAVPAPRSGTPSPAEVAAVVDRGRQEAVDPFLLAELDRARDGLMRDIVETIQRDQLELVSDDRPGTLVVQGGPGTGKTAVGLHRVTWLLDNSRFTADQILVVGPHQEFLDYVRGVLPALGRRGVATRRLGSLWEGETPGTDTDEQRRVKTDGRMAEVLKRAVDNTVRPSALTRFLVEGGFQVLFEGTTLTAGEADIERFYSGAREAGGPQNTQRTRFVNSLTNHLVGEAVRLRGDRSLDRRLQARIQANTSVSGLINAMWPRVSAAQLLRLLLNDPDVLREAAEGVLSDEEQRALIRPRAKRAADEPWTEADLVCLEELESLVSGVELRRYRHIVVDEAQDLTPMQARSLARRCPSGSMTVLGDLAQSTGAHRYGDWSAFAEQLSPSDGWHTAELTTGYRVPSEVMAFVKDLAAAVSPTTGFPESIRSLGAEAVRVVSTTSDRLLAEVETRIRDLADAGEQRSIAVIVPDEALTEAAGKHLTGTVPRSSAGAAPDIRVLSASQVNGLEFDHVVVVEPGLIALPEGVNLGRLYVALTRCTQSLTVVHALPLPEELGGPRRTGEPAEPPTEAATGVRADARPAPSVPGTPVTTDSEQRNVPTVAETEAAVPDGFLETLRQAVRADRENRLHKQWRHILTGELIGAGMDPDEDSETVDILCSGPAGTILYEVVGEDGHTYAGMREGATRALEARYSAEVKIDHVFLVLPRPPAEPWAVDAVSRAFGVSVIWRDGGHWAGPRVGIALGGEA